jgi:hypothetical protein
MTETKIPASLHSPRSRVPATGVHYTLVFCPANDHIAISATRRLGSSTTSLSSILTDPISCWFPRSLPSIHLWRPGRSHSLPSQFFSPRYLTTPRCRFHDPWPTRCLAARENGNLAGFCFAFRVRLSLTRQGLWHPSGTSSHLYSLPESS